MTESALRRFVSFWEPYCFPPTKAQNLAQNYHLGKHFFQKNFGTTNPQKEERDHGTNGNNRIDGKQIALINFRVFRYFRLFRDLLLLSASLICR
jgi:hypothetical protein